MTRKWNLISGGIAVLFAVGAAVVAGQGAWHDGDGNVHGVHGGRAVFISEDDATEFDLSELAEGELRVFGSKDKQITAERDGDTVTITHEKRGEHSMRSVTCLVDRDTCKILTFDEDPEKVMIVVEKSRECHNGVGDCGVEVEVGAIADDSAHVIVEKLVDCEDDEDCAELVDVVIGAAPHHGIHADESHNVFVHRLGEDDDQTLLRCPEGDATLRVDAQEAKDTFLCPKHSVPLEQIGTPHTIKILRKATPHAGD